MFQQKHCIHVKPFNEKSDMITHILSNNTFTSTNPNKMVFSMSKEHQDMYKYIHWISRLYLSRDVNELTRRIQLNG